MFEAADLPRDKERKEQRVAKTFCEAVVNKVWGMTFIWRAEDFLECIFQGRNGAVFNEVKEGCVTRDQFELMKPARVKLEGGGGEAGTGREEGEEGGRGEAGGRY